MKYIIAVLIIGLAILTHEFGHFIAAKAVKIPIQIFSIGFGPKLCSFKRCETEYRLSLIPIGGYVLPEVENEKDFYRYPVYKRVVMSLGGPFVNIILAAMFIGIINILSSGFSFYNFMVKPFIQASALSLEILRILPTLFSSSGNVSGIVGTVAQGGKVIGGDVLNSINFFAILSINFAVFNLLPIPVLDGGKIVLYLMEKIHPKFKKLHFPLAIAGWVFVLGLMLYTTVVDITRYI